MKTTANFPASRKPDDKLFFKTITPSVSITESINPAKKTRIHQNTSTEKKITVFLIDDDVLFLKALEYSITSKLPGLTIKTFQTGESALQQMKQKPDVVILDYFLNSETPYAWNGIQILKQIKVISPKTKVVMLSSQDSLEVANNCIDSGCFDYITKSESALVRINNILTNIVDDIKINDKSVKPYQIVMILILILLLILNFLFRN